MARTFSSLKRIAWPSFESCTARIAAEHGATVVHVPQRGFGAAAAAGLEAATADVVCFCDADASMDPAQLPRVAGPVLAGEADLVLGRRRPTSRSAWPLHARIANTALGLMLRRRTGRTLHDLGLESRVVAVKETRSITKADMALNDACPEIRVEPDTFKVWVDGEEIVPAPVAELPLAQRYELF